MNLKLINGNRAQLEMEFLLKIAERNLSEQELQALFAPLKRRAQLSIVSDSRIPLPSPPLPNQKTE